MKPDPIIDPPGIVQPALFADRLNAIMAEAQGFGRKTIEQKIATGRKLLEAKTELDDRNDKATSAKDRQKWPNVLKRFGFSDTTARRLMKAALSHNPTAKMAYPIDAIYDDGVDPSEVEGKTPCRDCRMMGKQYDPKCPACRSRNRKPKEPKDGTVRDMDGAPVPGHLIEVFKEGAIIREFTSYLLDGVKSLAGLVERPGCSALNVPEIAKRLKNVKSYATRYRPGLPHDDCDGKGCDGCKGRGWQTVMAVLDERAKAAAEKDRERLKSVSDAPIPE